VSDDDERGPRASPFTLRLVDGERVRIDHPEFALLPPGLTGPREWLGDTDPERERFAGLVGTGELRG